MPRLSLFLFALFSASLLIANAQNGLVNVNVGTSTNNSAGASTQSNPETLALNYNISRLDNSLFSWNNEWSAQQTSANQYQLSNSNGDIINLSPNGTQNISVLDVLGESAVSPDGNSSTVGSYVANSLAKAYLAPSGSVQKETTTITITNSTTGQQTSAAAANNNNEDGEEVEEADEHSASGSEVDNPINIVSPDHNQGQDVSTLR